MIDQAENLRKMTNKNKSDKKNKSNTRIITVASGKGGVGKSNIAINLGISLQKLEQRVLIIDGDLGMANLDILLGITPQYNLSHVLNGKCNIEEAILRGDGDLYILPGTSGIEDFIDIGYRKVIKLLEISSQLEENYDIILVDVGAGAHHSVRNFMLAADQALIVLTPEPTAIMDAYSLVKVMADNDYSKKLELLINQTQSKKEASRVFERMSKVIKKYLEVEVQYLGYIPFDPNIPKSVKKQKPFVQLFPETEASNYIEKLAYKMLDKKKNNSSKGVKGFMYRIIGMFNRSN